MSEPSDDAAPEAAAPQAPAPEAGEARPFWKTPMGVAAIVGGVVAVLAVAAVASSFLGSGGRAEIADEELDRFLRRSDLDQVFEYDRVSAGFGGGFTIHEVGVEIGAEEAGFFEQVRVNAWDMRDDVLHRASIEIDSVRSEEGAELAGGAGMLSGMLLQTGMITRGVDGAIRTAPDATTLRFDWRYDPRDEAAVFVFEQETEGLGAFTFEAEFEQLSPDAMTELLEAIEDLGAAGGESVAMGRLGVLFAAQSFLEELENLELVSARQTLRDDGLIAAIEQIMAYERGVYDGDFSLADNLFEPGALDDPRLDERLEEIEDALGSDNFEALQNAVRPGGRLVITTDFRRPVAVFDERGGRIQPNQDLFDFAELIDDGEVVFSNR